MTGAVQKLVSAINRTCQGLASVCSMESLGSLEESHEYMVPEEDHPLWNLDASSHEADAHDRLGGYEKIAEGML